MMPSSPLFACFGDVSNVVIGVGLNGGRWGLSEGVRRAKVCGENRRGEAAEKGRCFAVIRRHATNLFWAIFHKSVPG